MRDPLEELTADGMIRTGASRNISAPFRPLIADVIDLLLINGSQAWAQEVGTYLSQQSANLCRAIEIGVAQTSDFAGAGDAAYGNQVFLRHYCVPLAGRDELRRHTPFAGDTRAARGFNGDISDLLTRWQGGGADAQRVARKTLVAAAGIISIRKRTSTTDRATAVRAWLELDLSRHEEVAQLSAWAEGTSTASPGQLETALAADGVVAAVAARFESEIGLWAKPDGSSRP